MPWVPELFTAPALSRILDQRRRDALAAVPYFDGLMADDPEPLVESFAGEPEVHDPVRGRIKRAIAFRAFRAFVAEISAWLRIASSGSVLLATCCPPCPGSPCQFAGKWAGRTCHLTRTIARAHG